MRQLFSGSWQLCHFPCMVATEFPVYKWRSRDNDQHTIKHYQFWTPPCTEYTRQHSASNRECFPKHFNLLKVEIRQQKTWDNLFSCCCFVPAITIFKKKKKKRVHVITDTVRLIGKTIFVKNSKQKVILLIV